MSRHRPKPPYRLPTRFAYDRNRDLARLLLLWPGEVTAVDPESRQILIARLRRELRRERQRGIAGHWTYDLARHAQLLTAYRAELAALECTGRGDMRRIARRQGPIAFQRAEPQLAAADCATQIHPMGQEPRATGLRSCRL